MRNNMKVGGFRLAAILYYTLNELPPSNDPLKIQINLPRKELSAARVGREKHALSISQISLDQIHLAGNIVASVILPPII